LKRLYVAEETVDAVMREAAWLGANAALLEYDDVSKPSKVAVAVSAPITTSDGVPLDRGFSSRAVHPPIGFGSRQRRKRGEF